MDLTSVKTLKNLLNQYNIRLNKNLGQNFLLSRRVLADIIKAADLKPDDVVLEIGPGLGGLTFELAKHVKKVIAVEKDMRLAEALQMINRSNYQINNLEIINSDILKVSSQMLGVRSYKVVANLPYQITSPVLWKFLYEEKYKPELMVLMVQQEVAERMVAKPGQMSVLSVLVQYYADVHIVKNVKKGSFYPEPKVDSAIIKLKVKNDQRKINEEIFIKLVKVGFSNKRKMLKNNLTSLVKDKQVAELLEQINLNAKIRAQELSIAGWIKLYQVVYNK